MANPEKYDANYGRTTYAYLKDALTRLPQITIQKVPELLPSVWGKPAPPSLKHSIVEW